MEVSVLAATGEIQGDTGRYGRYREICTSMGGSVLAAAGCTSAPG